MKFFRQLAAALLVVAVVVALGVAWEHSSEASWIAVPQGGGPGVHRIVEGPPPGQNIHGGPGTNQVRVSFGGGAPFNLSNFRDVGRTTEIEAVVAAAVVMLDLIRRRQRRARRATR